MGACGGDRGALHPPQGVGPEPQATAQPVRSSKTSAGERGCWWPDAVRRGREAKHHKRNGAPEAETPAGGRPPFCLPGNSGGEGHSPGSPSRWVWVQVLCCSMRTGSTYHVPHTTKASQDPLALLPVFRSHTHCTLIPLPHRDTHSAPPTHPPPVQSSPSTPSPSHQARRPPGLVSTLQGTRVPPLWSPHSLPPLEAPSLPPPAAPQRQSATSFPSLSFHPWQGECLWQKLPQNRSPGISN